MTIRTPFEHLLPSDDDLDRQFNAALLRAPEGEKELQAAIWSLLRKMERDIDAMRADLRDCNVIAARIIDRCVRFEATGMPY